TSTKATLSEIGASLARFCWTSSISRRCHLFFHFLTPCPPRRDLTLRASVTVERGRSHLKVTVRRARAVAPVKAVARQATKYGARPVYLCIGVSWLASFCQRPSRRIQASSARNSPCSG